MALNLGQNLFTNTSQTPNQQKSNNTPVFGIPSQSNLFNFGNPTQQQTNTPNPGGQTQQQTDTNLSTTPTTINIFGKDTNSNIFGNKTNLNPINTTNQAQPSSTPNLFENLTSSTSQPQTQKQSSSISFGNSNTTNPHQPNLFGQEKPKTENQTNQNTLLTSTTTKPVENTNQLFSSLSNPKPAEQKVNLTSNLFNQPISAKKDESKNQQQQTSKDKLNIQHPEAMPNEMSQLDQLTFESFFRTTLDEGLTKWKNELNFQTQKMQTMTQNFKTLDGQIETNFESIKNMILYRQRLQNDSEKSLSELKDIILEEDQVLEHLNYLDNTLGNYLEEIDKTNLKAKNQDKESQLYNNIIEVSKSIDSIELVIKDANSKVSLNQIEEKPKEDNNHSTSLIYENERLHEKMPIEKSEMDYILNSFYVSIRAIQSMQQDLNRKILQAESDINEMHKEPYHNKFMKDNYN